MKIVIDAMQKMQVKGTEPPYRGLRNRGVSDEM
jgi:hypothetical protein